MTDPSEEAPGSSAHSQPSTFGIGRDRSVQEWRGGADNAVTAADPLSTPRPSLATFGFLWTFALLYHQAGYGLAVASPVDTALTLALIAALAWPGSPRLLGLVAFLQVGAMIHALPYVVNHWFFTAFVSAGILIAWLVSRWPAGSHQTLSGDTAFLDTLASSGRLCAVALYGVSGFHKLNSDFFTSGVSCALALTNQATGFLGVRGALPEPGPAVIWLAVVVELGLAVLLLVPRFRLSGVVLGIGFHLVMAIAGYPRFSATGVALLSLFLPSAAFGRGAAMGAVRGARISPMALRVAMIALLVAATAAGATWQARAFLTSQVILSCAVLGAALYAWRASLGLPALMALRPRRPLGWVTVTAPLLVFAAASQPYLGLPTDRALGMYSNLRTEGGTSNHFVVPARWQIFPFQRDLVSIVSSTSPELQRLADSGMALPFEELRARLTEELRLNSGDVSLRYWRGGVEYDVPAAREDRLLDLPVSRFRVMFFRFRAVEIEGPRACSV